MQFISKFNKVKFNFFFIMCFDIFSKYVWILLLKDKKGIIIAITNAFKKILESNHKPNKIRVVKGSEFYNRSLKPFLQNNNTEMYSTHNEEKFVVAERFIRTLKNKIYKCMTSISKNVLLSLKKKTRT